MQRRHSHACIHLAAVIFALAGCSSPYGVKNQDDLVRALQNTIRGQLVQSERWSEPVTPVRGPGIEELGIDPRFHEELRAVAGPSAYEGEEANLGLDLFGQPMRRAVVNLERVVLTSVANNLDLSYAKLSPQIVRSQVAEGEAAFDWTLFMSLQEQKIDQPRARQIIGGSTTGVRADTRDVTSLRTGLRKALITGGEVTLQQELIQTENYTPGVSATPDPAQQVAWLVQLDQPLLRGFGSDVALAQIRLARNAERDRVAELESQLEATVSDAERAYWRLVQAYYDVLIFERNLARAEETAQKVEARRFDASPDQLSDARAQVERRRQFLVRSQLSVAEASDELKGLMNDPDLTLGSDVVLVPADFMIDEPITFSLHDAIMNAMAYRPEIRQALISIDDTSIRLQLANNARLPRLDLRLQMSLNGLDDDYRAAYNDMADGQFIDYLIGLNFEMPLGNRGAEALELRRELERAQATVGYQATVQGVLRDVVGALRTVRVSYQLIEQARLARLAEAENLRVFGVQNDLLRELSVLRLAEEFRRQDALAQAERDEISYLVQYNSAIATLYQAMGLNLKRNGIDFEAPDGGR